MDTDTELIFHAKGAKDAPNFAKATMGRKVLDPSSQRYAAPCRIDRIDRMDSVDPSSLRYDAASPPSHCYRAMCEC